MLQLGHRAKHRIESKLVAPREKAFRVIHPLGHRDVDVAHRSDTQEHRVDRLIDQHRENSIEDLGSELAILMWLGSDGTLAVVIVASATLAPEKASFDQPTLRQRGPVTRIVKERLEHGS